MWSLVLLFINLVSAQPVPMSRGMPPVYEMQEFFGTSAQRAEASDASAKLAKMVIFNGEYGNKPIYTTRQSYDRFRDAAIKYLNSIPVITPAKTIYESLITLNEKAKKDRHGTDLKFQFPVLFEDVINNPLAVDAQDLGMARGLAGYSAGQRGDSDSKGRGSERSSNSEPGPMGPVNTQTGMRDPGVRSSPKGNVNTKK